MKILNWISILAGIIYWGGVMSFISLILLVMPLGFLIDVSAITGSGFAGRSYGPMFIGICGLFIGISMLIPPFRRAYRKFPWLHSFIKIMFINLVILNIGEAILNFGYEVQSTSRHNTFFILMIVEIILCRVGMCIYFKLKPVKAIEG